MSQGERWRVVALLAIGALLGAWSASEATRLGVRNTLYDFSYGPAVMLACGHGFTNPRPGQSPPLDDFLATRTDRLSCSALPAAVAGDPLTGYQRTFRYLMWVVASAWWVTGVSWSALAWLAALMMSLTAALGYGVLRLVARPSIAVTGALILVSSPLHVNYVTDLRNYPKAPLILALGVLLGLLLRAGNRRRVAALAAALGAVLGIGLGFRQDLLVYVPLILVAVVALFPGDWRARLAPALTAFGALVLAASPVLAAYAPGGGASTPHVVTLGLMSPFDSALGVSNGALYEWGYYNEDSFAYATLAGHGQRFLRMDTAMPVYSDGYDAASASYLAQVVGTFPADFVTRAYASVIRLIELPSSTPFTVVPVALAASPMASAWRWRGAVLEKTGGLWTGLAVSALFLVALTSIWRALIVAALLGAVLGYPALQFHERHFFALDIVPLAAGAFAIERLLGLRREGLRDGVRRSGLRAVAFAVALVALVLTPWTALRAYQATQVRSLFYSYLAAPVTPAQFDEHATADGRVLLTLTGEATVLPQPGRSRTDVYVFALGGEACEFQAVDLTVKYQGSHANPDFSITRLVRLGLLPQLTRVVLPVFAYHSDPADGSPVVTYRFDGVGLPADQRSCLNTVERIVDPSPFAVAVTAVLPQDWAQATPYQVLSEWETPVTVTPTVVVSPPDTPRPARHQRAPLAAWASLGAPLMADVVTVSADGQWNVDGRGGLGGRGGMFYLAHLPGLGLEAGQAFVAEGVLYKGGLSVGVVRDGAWVGQVTIREPGPFVAVVVVPATARYDLVVANSVAGRLGGNHFSMKRIGVTD